MSFDGYSDELIPYLRALPDRDPDWFKANKSTYSRVVVSPTKALVVDIGDHLRPELTNISAIPKTNGSIAPINNDLRFTPDKSRYKDHLLLRFWEGSPKKFAPTLFVRIAPGGIGFASGVIPSGVDTWRQAVASDAGAQLNELLSGLIDGYRAEVVGQELKRVPAPYPADHNRGELLRHKMLQVRWQCDVPTSICDPEFGEWCAERLGPALPVHRWLVEHL